jgi:hypothetical protein
VWSFCGLSRKKKKEINKNTIMVWEKYHLCNFPLFHIQSLRQELVGTWEYEL